MATNDGGTAFPRPAGVRNGDIGMSLRDWFAGQAVVGVMLSYPGQRLDTLSRRAYEMADAMLAERNKEQNPNV